MSNIIASNDILSPECQQAVSVFQNAYEEMKENSNMCVEKRVQSGIHNLKKINEMADNVQAELHEVRNDAIDCVSHVIGLTKFFQAMKCLNVVSDFIIIDFLLLQKNIFEMYMNFFFLLLYKNFALFYVTQI